MSSLVFASEKQKLMLIQRLAIYIFANFISNHQKVEIPKRCSIGDYVNSATSVGWVSQQS